jgi:hypothetical protein
MHGGAPPHFLLAVWAFLHKAFVYQYTRYHTPEQNSLPLQMLSITSSIKVTNQCDNKLAYKSDDCKHLADAIIRVKERNTIILNSVTDLLDWLSDDQSSI